MKRTLFLQLVCTMILLAPGTLPLLGGTVAASMPHVQGTRRIVLEQLERLLAADPTLQMIGQGSWLRSGAQAVSQAGGISRAYSDPLLGGTSDHDLRLVMQGDEKALTSRWKTVQDELRQGIKALFPENADPKAIEKTLARFGYGAEEAAAISKQGSGAIVEKILKSINVYSPPQLVRHVVDEKTAAVAFKRLGRVPNLGGRIVEGIWGEGSLAATQEFEAGGRLFYSSGKGMLRTGFVDLVHMAEGYGRYSLRGAANMSYQWAEKAAEAMLEGDASLVAKYLKRLKGTFDLAIRKGNLGSGTMADTLSQLDEFIAKSEAGEIAGEPLRRFLKNARMQASLLGELARNPGATDRQIIMAILESSPSSRWGKLGEWFRNLWETADNVVLFERSVQGVFLAYTFWQVAGTWGEKGMEQALRQAGADLTMLASLPVGSVLMLTNYMLDGAKEAGYNIAVSAQEWRDFLAGISSVKGYEGQTGLEISIERLATQCPSPEEVQRKVELQAFNISKLKETGAPQESEATAASREAIREKLIERMGPIVLAEWLRTRKNIITEYLDLALELDYRWNNLVLRATSNPALITLEENGPATAEMLLETDQDLREIQDLLGRMEAKIEPLGGPEKLVQFGHNGSVVWEFGGQQKEVKSYGNLRDLFQPQTLELQGRGSHALTARFKLDLNVMVGGGSGVAIDVLDAKPLLERSYERTIPLTVEVTTIARAKVEPVTSAKLSTPKEAAAAELFTLTWDRSQVPNFKPGKYRVVLAPSGTRLTMTDLMLLSFDPTGYQTNEHIRHAVEVISEKVDGDRVEIEVQVPQVTSIQKAEQFDLAFIFLDRDASLGSQLEKAMADLEKAQEQLDKKLESMKPEEREELIKKMEEAAAKAQAEPQPAAVPEDEPLPPGNALSFPILIRPVGIEVQLPDGWQDQRDERPFMVITKKESARPEMGDHVWLKAEFSVVLDDGKTGIDAGSTVDSLFTAGPNVAVKPITLSGYKGKVGRYPVQREGDQVKRHSSQSGEALLKKGSVFMRIQFNSSAAGWRKVRIDDKGQEIVEFDTRDAADRQFEGLRQEVESILASVRIGTGKQAGDAAPPPDSKPREDAYVRLIPAKTACEPGEFVEIQAVVENSKSAEGPFRYEWGGNHAGSGEKVTFFASEPGSYPITVMVYGAKGLIGSTSVTVSVQ